ncbi:dihydroneopterin aldolase [Halorhodospira halochloris]|uniref:7,8-dihydroneopterin aldolase n=1 Tax=Halorhodospira halochloris TaxID=1052 RepID=A0A120MZB6_HALHR|nr:dihydroneopterin aldolase [Halorhodospira halochloris]MBK1650720.1 dihydroneopterin aldolase [Halorhodospira halochloris]MCG5530924.1 dihydroneopterin aldolase [Halorhodospira halochloris]MCG5549143.1 dihydroneopterin aldolase [Halorhodospira halochloris]BAU56787.1 dihydroneopterin aldolase [Halorhodospira halochloris]
MDLVFVRGLEVETVIGIFEWERRISQKVSLDLEMATDVSRAAASDSIDDALDYKALGKRIIAYVGASEFLLVETLAEGVAGIVREEFKVSWVRLSVSKPGALRGAKDVGVTIERGQRPDH